MPAPANDRYSCPQCHAIFRHPSGYCPIDGSPVVDFCADPLVGNVLAGRYRIEACVGRGGMACVYRAQHIRMSRRFAVKVLYGDIGADPKMRERFAHEAQAASRLAHPNVVSVVDFGETPAGLLYLVMDFVEGRELSTIIAKEAPLPSRRVYSIFRQLCAGLVHAHDHGLIHRDFKGDNVIVSRVDDQDLACIVDFGLSVPRAVSDRASLTTVGMVLGTPAYMSPEQATGGEIDHRSDLFSLGLVLYEMLSGVMPFEGTPVVIAQQNLTQDPPWIRQRIPGLQVNPDLERIARKLLGKRPADRFQDAREIIELLDRIAGVTTTHTLQLEPAHSDIITNPLSSYSKVMPPRNWRFRVLAVTFALAGMVVALLAVLRASVSPPWFRSAPPSQRQESGPGEESAIVPIPAPSLPPVTGAASSVTWLRVASLLPRSDVHDQPAPSSIEASRATATQRHHRRRHRDGQRSRCASRCDEAAIEPPGAGPPAALARAPERASTPIEERQGVSISRLLALHRLVGEQLDQHASGRDRALLSDLRRRYLRIAILHAQRTPVLRREARDQLLDIYHALVVSGSSADGDDRGLRRPEGSRRTR